MILGVYVLQRFVEGRLKVQQIYAECDGEAILQAAMFLRVPVVLGRMPSDAFAAAGGIALFCGMRKVFPEPVPRLDLVPIRR